MKTLVVLLFSTSCFAATHTMKPGDTYISQEKGESISCHVPTCKIDFKYITKEYQVWTPKNEIFSKHKVEAEALDSAGKLVTLKVCESLNLNYKKK